MRLTLLLSLALVGAGFFYPALAAYQQRTRVAALLASDDFTGADRALQELSRWNGQDPHTSYLKAVLARRTERIEAFEHWSDSARKLGADPELLDLQAKFLEVQRGKIDPAAELELSAQAESFGSDDIAHQTYEAIARGYLTTYRLKEAWQCLEYWLEWRPDTVSARMMRGEIAQRTGLHEVAIDEYRKILAQSPDNVVAQEKLADSLLQINEVDEAAQLLRDVCEQTPEMPQPRIGLAKAESRLGNLQASRAAIDEALRLGVDPQQRAQCGTILGQLALANQQPQAAVEYLLVAVELAPHDAVSHLALGRALTLTGEKAKGQVHLDKAQEIRDSYEQIQAWTREVIDHPRDPQLRTQIGKALIDQGLQSEGVRWIRTALVCDKDFAPAKEILDKMAISHGLVP